MGGSSQKSHGWLRAGRRRVLARSGSTALRGLRGSSMWLRCSVLQFFRTYYDFCLITPRVAAWRAVQTGKSDCVFARFGSGQSPQPSAWFVSGTARPGRSSLTSSTPHAKQVALQAASGQWPDPSPGANSPQDCSRPGSAQVRTRTVGAQAPHLP